MRSCLEAPMNPASNIRPAAGRVKLGMAWCVIGSARAARVLTVKKKIESIMRMMPRFSDMLFMVWLGREMPSATFRKERS